jgi:hypothetical protein
MVVSDWTFPSDWGNITLDTDVPSGSSSPSLNVSTSGAVVALGYPTSGTINGSTVTGINSGQIEVWFKFVTARSTTSRSFGVFFRCTDKTIASFDGYDVRVLMNSSGDTVRITTHTNSTNGSLLQSSATSSAISSGTWYHLRVTWTTSGGSLIILVEIDFGSGYVAQNGAGYVDAAPVGSSGSNELGLYTVATAVNFKTDDFKVYS